MHSPSSHPVAMDVAPPQPVLAYADDHTDPPAVVLGYVAFKTLALWLAVAAVLDGVLGLLQFTGRGWAHAMDSPATGLVYVTPGLVYGIASGALLVYARPLARRLLRMRGDAIPRAEARTLLGLVSVATGILLLANSVGPLAGAAVEIVQSMRQAGVLYFQRVSLESQAPMLVRLAVGAVLFLRPGWVVTMWERHSR